MESEILKEGWVTFFRFYCKEGYIDRWVGDCINDPNNDKISMYQLNSTTEYFRFNNGKWINKSNLSRHFFHDMREEKEIFTAEEIFKAHFNTES